MSLIALPSLWVITTLPSLHLGVPYPFFEHGAHMRACGHHNCPSFPWLVPPKDPLGLLLAGPPLDEAGVDDILKHPSNRRWWWLLLF